MIILKYLGREFLRQALRCCFLITSEDPEILCGQLLSGELHQRSFFVISEYDSKAFLNLYLAKDFENSFVFL